MFHSGLGEEMSEMIVEDYIGMISLCPVLASPGDKDTQRNLESCRQTRQDPRVSHSQQVNIIKTSHSHSYITICYSIQYRQISNFV